MTQAEHHVTDKQAERDQLAADNERLRERVYKLKQALLPFANWHVMKAHDDSSPVDCRFVAGALRLARRELYAPCPDDTLPQALDSRDGALLALREALKETCTSLVIASDNARDAAKTDSRWEGVDEKLLRYAREGQAALTSTDQAAEQAIERVRADERERMAKRFDELAAQAEQTANQRSPMDDRGRKHDYQVISECKAAARIILAMKGGE